MKRLSTTAGQQRQPGILSLHEIGYSWVVLVWNQKMYFPFLVIPWGMVGGYYYHYCFGYSGYFLLYYLPVEQVKLPPNLAV